MGRRDTESVRSATRLFRGDSTSERKHSEEDEDVSLGSAEEGDRVNNDDPVAYLSFDYKEAGYPIDDADYGSSVASLTLSAAILSPPTKEAAKKADTIVHARREDDEENSRHLSPFSHPLDGQLHHPRKRTSTHASFQSQTSSKWDENSSMGQSTVMDSNDSSSIGSTYQLRSRLPALEADQRSSSSSFAAVSDEQDSANKMVSEPQHRSVDRPITRQSEASATIQQDSGITQRPLSSSHLRRSNHATSFDKCVSRTSESSSIDGERDIDQALERREVQKVQRAESEEDFFKLSLAPSQHHQQRRLHGERHKQLRSGVVAVHDLEARDTAITTSVRQFRLERESEDSISDFNSDVDDELDRRSSLDSILSCWDEDVAENVDARDQANQLNERSHNSQSYPTRLISNRDPVNNLSNHVGLEEIIGHNRNRSECSDSAEDYASPTESTDVSIAADMDDSAHDDAGSNDVDLDMDSSVNS